MLADPQFSDYKSSRVEKNRRRANELYRKAMHINIERMAEDGDKCACTCLGEMYYYGNGVDQNYSRAMTWYR